MSSGRGRREDPRDLLPRGLCALLVVAAALALFPRWAEPVFGPARWLMCLPLRALPAPAVAADLAAVPFTDDAALARLDAEAVVGGGMRMGDRLEPLVCRVLDRRAPGAAGLPTLLVLDRTWRGIAGCTGLVTRGDCLVGCIGQPRDVDEVGLAEQAVVRCLHAAPRGEAPRRFLASTRVRGEDLRLVVEPGTRIDVWPLRIPLLEDPYLAARLGGSGETVRTCAQTFGDLPVPDGLVLGALRVWGYADGDGPVLPVGFFVEPACDPRAVATVVLWRPVTAEAPGAGVVAEDVVARDVARAVVLPPTGQRMYLVRTGARMRVGAAVLARDGYLFGAVVEAGPGDAIATAFATVGRNWSLLLVPDDGRPPIECAGRVRRVAADGVELELATRVPPVTGAVLTAGNGADSPAGLRVGRIAAVDADGTRLRVERPHLDLGFVFVCRRRGRAP